MNFHFWKQLGKFIFKKGHVTTSHHFYSRSQGKPHQQLFLPTGRDMLGHLAKYDDGFLLLGYCVELFKI